MVYTINMPRLLFTTLASHILERVLYYLGKPWGFPAHHGCQMNDVGRLVLVEDGFGRLGVGQVPVFG